MLYIQVTPLGVTENFSQTGNDMQIDAQDFLRLAEKANDITFFDLETSNLNADYGGVLVASFKPFGKKPFSFSVKSIGNDQKVVREAFEAMSNTSCWVSYFGKGFDVPFLNARLLKWGLPQLPKKHHIDMYYVLKFALKVSRRSQGHLVNWLKLPEQKMSVSADVWATIGGDIEGMMPTMVKRCESDCKGLEDLYVRTRHLVREIQR